MYAEHTFRVDSLVRAVIVTDIGPTTCVLSGVLEFLSKPGRMRRAIRNINSPNNEVVKLCDEEAASVVEHSPSRTTAHGNSALIFSVVILGLFCCIESTHG